MSDESLSWAEILCGPDLWNQLVAVFSALPGSEARQSDIEECALDIYHASEAAKFRVSDKEQYRGTYEVTRELSALNNQLSAILNGVKTLSEEAGEILERCAEERESNLFECYGGLCELKFILSIVVGPLEQDTVRGPLRKPIKYRAAEVTERAAMAYEKLTSKRMTLGPFRPYLTDLFKVLEIDASADSQARAFNARRRRNWRKAPPK